MAKRASATRPLRLSNGGSNPGMSALALRERDASVEGSIRAPAIGRRWYRPGPCPRAMRKETVRPHVQRGFWFADRAHQIPVAHSREGAGRCLPAEIAPIDRESTRLNSSHLGI